MLCLSVKIDKLIKRQLEEIDQNSKLIHIKKIKM